MCQCYSPPEGYIPTMKKPLLGHSYSCESEDNSLDDAVGPNRFIIPFIACGDLSGFDTEKSYDLYAGEKSHLPTQPPINPSYQEAISLRKQKLVNQKNKKP